MAKSFEDNITRLEEIVSQLERGDAKLADSLKLFEEGTKLVTSCGKMLDEAELPPEPSSPYVPGEVRGEVEFRHVRFGYSCGKMLDEAEQKVVRLTKGADGAPVEAPFAAEE